MSAFSFQIITPEAVVFEADCKEINLPGVDGRFGVLAGHMNFVSLLAPGTVIAEVAETGNVLKFEIAGGFADVTSGRCVILVESAKAQA
ncbi:MAG: synthase epsilon subunit [Candidatus Midichloriaceae bacterium]|jgi:F-type H+-transporting ATPase subunit epsilon|nr:synthase epsilon subunit [Candidatus Midichloriaceae bacterium]